VAKLVKSPPQPECNWLGEIPASERPLQTYVQFQPTPEIVPKICPVMQPSIMMRWSRAETLVAEAPYA
jgi:hypothetical protein